jgi:hypothetical protein
MIRGMSIHLGEPQEFTTSLVQAARVASAPEFLDSEGVEACFGLKKSILFRLLAERKIRAVSIRKPGTTRGKRLFDCSSIRAFLNQNCDVEPEANA